MAHHLHLQNDRKNISFENITRADIVLAADKFLSEVLVNAHKRIQRMRHKVKFHGIM
jgi:hypothetical protein